MAEVVYETGGPFCKANDKSNASQAASRLSEQFALLLRSPCYRAALRYGAMGLAPIILCPSDHKGMDGPHLKTCASPGKRPIGRWEELQVKRNTPQTLKRVWTRHPTANVGSVMGAISSVIRIDVDGPAGLDALRAAFGDDLPPTATFRSGGGADRIGLLYRVPAGHPSPTVPFRDATTGAEPLKIIGDGGQSVLPPSLHQSGELYEWVDGLSPDDEAGIAEAPGCVLDLLAGHAKAKSGQPSATFSAAGKSGEAADEPPIPAGSRNSTLASLAGTLRNRGVSAAGLAGAIASLNQSECSSPLPDYEVQGIVTSVAGYAAGKAPWRFADAGADGDGDVAEADTDPHRLARVVKNSAEEEGRALQFWGGQFCEWDGRYRDVPDHEMRARVTSVVKLEADRLNRLAAAAAESAPAPKEGKKGKPKPTAFQVTKPLVSNVIQALAGDTLLTGVSPPCWIYNITGPSPSGLLQCRNGILDLSARADGLPGCLLAPTSGYFSFGVLPHDYCEGAAPPLGWFAFLDSLWPGDAQSISALQEWFGYLLTADTRYQKALLLVGPRRSGKGTIGRVIRALLGDDEVICPTLNSLTTNFGLQPLLHKKVAIISDARLSGRSDLPALAERLLSISGEDAITIDRKHLPSVTTRLLTRFVVLSNELPRISDASGALAGRFVVLRQTESFFGREDYGLEKRLRAELQGILLWAVEGWCRLRERGRLTQPDSALQDVRDLEDLSSPVGAFVREWCQVGPGRVVRKDLLYEAWSRWSETKGLKPTPANVFGRDLRACVQGIEDKQRRDGDGDRHRYYFGVDLRSAEDTPCP